jgi:hypothetical protein
LVNEYENCGFKEMNGCELAALGRDREPQNAPEATRIAGERRERVQ